MNEFRARWDEMNKTKKNNSKIGDLPYLKFGCDDITCVVAYLTFIDEMDKRAFKGSACSTDISAGLQNGLLRLIEGSEQILNE